MASIRKAVAAALQKEFVEGAIFRVDMDRVDVAPEGSTGILRSLPLTGDRDKVQPGDPVRVITVAGERVALVGDLALTDEPGEEVADASEIVMEENLARERGGKECVVGNFLDASGVVDPQQDQGLQYDETTGKFVNKTITAQAGPHTHLGTDITSTVSNAVDATNASQLNGLTRDSYGANAHVVNTDASGNLFGSSLFHLASRAAPAAPGGSWSSMWHHTDGVTRLMNNAGQTFPMAMTEIILPATAWYSSLGRALQPANGLAHFAHELRDGVVDPIDTNIFWPYGWNGRNIYVDILWSCSATGNVYWCLEARHQRGDQQISNTIIFAPNAIAAAGGWWGRYTTLNCGVLSTYTISGMAFRLYRYGNHANDTAAASAYLYSARIRCI